VQKHDLPIWVAKRLFVHVLIKVDFAAIRVARVCVVFADEIGVLCQWRAMCAKVFLTVADGLMIEVGQQ
jgi:hypothetical protein